MGERLSEIQNYLLRITSEMEVGRGGLIRGRFQYFSGSSELLGGHCTASVEIRGLKQGDIGYQKRVALAPDKPAGEGARFNKGFIFGRTQAVGCCSLSETGSLSMQMALGLIARIVDKRRMGAVRSIQADNTVLDN